ncbi:M56 family metallopeptidase [Shewanella sp. KX20019]|uniref:M56 family metallopeptidase n=1 Tax=Shewanella sp. KX20019 TaxID=2803864 RepID=UPI001927D11B|nr:M56 family metallopeptidase [Shewanella sp. KX20019]QQX78813.1 M56 family metallopeptidase [Shewanella sp. KX20019]
MIEGTLAVWLNISAIAVISFVAANIIVSILVAIFDAKVARFELKSRKVALWLVVTLPWVAALVVALYFSLSDLSSPFVQQTGAYAHWHHMTTFELASWHAATLILALLGLSFTVLKKLRALRQHQQSMQSLHGLSTSLSDGVYQLKTSELSAFASGFIKQRCYITSGLLANSSEDEQQVILMHERAHMASRDPLKKWLFNLLASFFVIPIAQRLKLQMVLAMEQAADNAVIGSKYSSTFIASTLVKVARLNANSHNFVDNEMVSSFGAEILEQRVYSLLGELTLKPISSPLTITLMIIVTAVSAYSIDAIHHLIETLFTH